MAKNEKDIEDLPERKYLAKGKEEGWIKKMPITCNVVVVDHRRFQPRQLKLDMKYVLHLNKVRNENDEKSFYPVVVFLNPDGELVLVDGFHRFEENRRRPKTCVSIDAYVVDVNSEFHPDQGADWEVEAIKYATLCNQYSSLPMNDEDKRKKVEMILSNATLKTWTNKAIHEHTGISETTIAKYRKEFAIRTGAPIKPRKPCKITHTPPTLLRPDVEPDVDELGHPPLGNPRAFHDWLLDRGVISEPLPNECTGFSIAGRMAGNRAVVLCPSSDLRQMQAAIGQAILYRGLAPHLTATVVLIKQKQKMYKRIYELLAAEKIEVVEPWDLVEIVKAKRGKDKGDVA